MSRKILLLMIVSITVTTQSLFALGLGEIKLKSGLNQPLNAEIVLLSIRGESNDQLKARLGSDIDFSRTGIDRLYFLTKIKFETITKANGQRVIHLTTKDAVKEPFLNFLVDLEWPNGKLLREYTLLLDPPVFDDAPEITVTPVTQAPRKAQRTPTKTQSRSTVTKPKWQGDIFGPTSAADTLWSIAAKTRPSRSISMNQAMVTLFEANPDAFMRGNINNLKRGATLRIPDEETFSQITQREALRMIAAHNDNWRSGKRMAPRVVMDTSDSSSSSSPTTSSYDDTGRLSLSTDEVSNGAGGSTAHDSLTEENNEVLKEQNESLQTQAESDATRIEQLERLLELKNEQLASIQNREKEISEDASTDTSQDTAPAETPTAVPVEVAESESNSEPMDVTPTAVNQPESKGMVDAIIDGEYNLYLGIAGALVLLMLIGSIMRRRNSDTSYQDAIASSAPVERENNTYKVNAEELPESADEVLTEEADEVDFSDPDLGTTESSDPLGEADIYIAYGKFEQAESLLLASIEDDPERFELNSKLLECYAEMKDQEKFEAQVESLSDAMASDSEYTNNIKDLYQSTWPEGQLFSETNETYEDDATNDDVNDINEVDELDDAEEFSFEDDNSESFEESFEEPEEMAENNEFEESVDELPSTEDVFGEESLDLENDINESEADADDVDTQLDLAKAYVEMGDFEGTREIIKEIMESGTEKQCAEAQEILDTINA